MFFTIGRWYENFKIKKAEHDPELTQNYDRLLLTKFPYYVALSEKSKIKFLIRLNRFIKTKRFLGRGGLEITDEMKILISASAIQLTFGLEYYWLNHYEEIILFPDVFHNPKSDEDHKGETSLGGRVILSWKHFLEGYSNSTDKLNLGLHEMAHALDLSRVIHDADDFFTVYYTKWYLESKGEFENMQDHPSFLRAYGGVNFREFFSVCVEHFFEAPAEFKKNLPDIYKHLTVLLRQDPLFAIEKSESNLNSISNTIPPADFIATPDFASRVSLWYSFEAIGIMLLRISVTFIVLFFAFKLKIYSVLIIILMLVYFFNSLLLTKFELFKEYLVITRPILFNRKFAFAFENIISVVFEYNNIENVVITYFEKGEIQTINILCTISSEDKLKLLSLLSDKKILVKNGD